MPTVKDVLRSYAATSPSLGSSKAPLANRSAQLATDLKTVSTSSQNYFALCFGAVIVTFMLSAALAVRYLDSPQQLSAMFGALGLTLTGLLARMAGLWKQKVTSDTLLALCAVADNDQRNTIVNALLKRL
jgi:hypothetical protein